MTGPALFLSKGLDACSGSSLKELQLARCPALKQFPPTGAEMEALKELDLRAAKKQVCKIAPEVVDALKSRFCKVRGGVIKKSKASKKKAAAPPA